MSKFFKNISYYPLLLASLVIVAHMAITHDHHSDNSISDEKCNTETHKDESTSKSSFPIHCHAFNDLINEKHAPLLKPNHAQLLKSNQALFSSELLSSGILSSDTFDSSLTELIINNNRYIDFQKPPINFGLLKYSPFRAPPTLV